MHCTPWVLLQVTAERTAVYWQLIWILCICLAGLLLAILLMRLVRILMSRRFEAAGRRARSSSAPIDPWSESARRVEVERSAGPESPDRLERSTDTPDHDWGNEDWDEETDDHDDDEDKPDEDEPNR
jgi:hypothetical protein